MLQKTLPPMHFEAKSVFGLHSTLLAFLQEVHPLLTLWQWRASCHPFQT